MLAKHKTHKVRLGALVLMAPLALVLGAAPALAQLPLEDTTTQQVGGPVGETTQQVGETINDTTTKVGDTIAETGGKTGDAIKDAGSTAGDTITDTGGTVGGTVGGSTGDTIKKTTDTVGGAVKDTSSTAGDTITKSTDTVGGAVQDAGGTVDGIVSGTGRTIDDLATALTGDGDKAKNRKSGSGAGNGSATSSGDALVAHSLIPDRTAQARMSGVATKALDDAGQASATASNTGLAELLRRALESVKRFAFPLALTLLVLAYVAIQGWVDRKDPKLALASLDVESDLLTFD